MLTVEDYEKIRLIKQEQDISQREIARTLGYSRKTVAKALKNAIPPGYRLSVARPKTVISSFTCIIDYYLEENKKIIRRKQRMNAKKIYELLRDNYGYTGHYCTVSRYIKSVNIYKKEVFMPLSFEPGQEAQVDWHEAIVYCNGVQKKQYVFCMKLCFSKAPFTISYDSMRIECFLDGHVKAFEYFGGVPKRIAYDNLKTAVKKILFNGDRILNRRFIELRSWYLFKTRFCNVAKGNEKGNVENLAKRSQSYFFSPIPEVSSTQELNIKLLSDCKKELLRKGSAPNTDKTIGELLEIERQNLNNLAEQPFQACRSVSTFASKQLLVTADTNSYSVPIEYAYQSCQVRIFVDRVEIYFKNELIACHKRCFGKYQFILDPLHYIKLLERKPGSLDNGRPFKGQSLGRDFEIMRNHLNYRYGSESSKRYINILLLFCQYSQEQVKEAVSVCVKCRAFSDEAVASFIRNGTISSSSGINGKLNNQGDGKRDLAIYNSLIPERSLV